jgi:DnaJ-class molecular chaperone
MSEQPKRPGDEPGTTQTGEVPCPSCGGSGRIGDRACRDCEGTGLVRQIVGDA